MNRREFLTNGAALGISVAAIPATAAPLHPVSLDTARFLLERPFRVKMGLPGPWAQTGEKYHIVCSGGEALEGEPLPFWCANKDRAIDSWFKEAMDYAIGKTGTLYWRDSPFIETVIPEDIPFYAVYSRFLISNQAEEWQFMEDYLPTRAG